MDVRISFREKNMYGILCSLANTAVPICHSSTSLVLACETVDCVSDNIITGMLANIVVLNWVALYQDQDGKVLYRD